MNVAIYARVSTSEQVKKGYSLSEQIRILKDYCKVQRWRIYDTYIDAGESGAKSDRPSFTRLKEDLKSGEIDRVLVWKLDRLGRSTKDILIALEDYILPAGADLVSLTESFDTQTAFGKATISLFSTMAQVERDQIRERLAVGREARAREGKYHGGSRPVGYRYENGKLVPDEYEAMIVRKIFEMYAAGSSAYGIARDLNAAGLIRHNGKVWARSHLANVLKRRVYIGEIQFHDEVFEGQHEAIIDRELFDRVQERRQNVKDQTPDGCSKRVRSMLGGLLWCSCCGGKLVHDHQNIRYKDTVRTYDTYICSNKKHHRKSYETNYVPCSSKRWKGEKLEEIILGEVRKLRLDPDHVVQVTEEEQEDNSAVIRAEIEKLNGQLSRLMDLYLDDSMPMDLLKKKTEALNEQKGKLQQQLSKPPEKKKIKKAEAVKLAASLDEVLASADNDSVREILHELIERIETDGSDVSIFWRF